MSMKLPFLNNKQLDKEKQFEKTDHDALNPLPEHVAIIMDGNGRWAKGKGLSRNEGHKRGMDIVRDITLKAKQMHIKTLTLYAFSTENWKRPKREVDFLMRLPRDFLHKFLPELIEENIRIETIGDFDALPRLTKEAIKYAKNKTKNNDGLLLNIALNYGGRFEILRAVKHLASDIEKNEVSLDTLDEELFSSYLYTDGLTDPDLLIRTSGEKRLSNFLLWQLAYTEFYFTDVLWPDFDDKVFQAALDDYQQRKRRYGGI